MPTKALLYAAEVMHLASHARTWGIRAGNVSFDFAKVMARKNALIKDFADYRRQQLAGGKFKFVRANASFVDEHTVTLTNLTGRIGATASWTAAVLCRFGIGCGAGKAPEGWRTPKPGGNF